MNLFIARIDADLDVFRLKTLRAWRAHGRNSVAIIQYISYYERIILYARVHVNKFNESIFDISNASSEALSLFQYRLRLAAGIFCAVLISQFDYELPPERIAQEPLSQRDASRMLLLERESGAFGDRFFAQLPGLLHGNELIVVNNARVLPARLFAHRVGIHAQATRKKAERRPLLRSRIEVLLLRRLDGHLWEALVRPGRKVRVGEQLTFEGGLAKQELGEQELGEEELHAEVIGRGQLGVRQLRFYGTDDVNAAIERIGHMPLPPYIRRADEPADRDRYQTVFAKEPGAVAAPTAGLHFTQAILETLRAHGLEIREITLAVGLGTFQPFHGERLEDHQMHAEAYHIPADTAEAITLAKRARRPIFAVGTTVVRALEDAAVKARGQGAAPGAVISGNAVADIFIQPGHSFSVVDQLLTNFHLPRSTLLVLVSAFGGREAVLAAYRHAVASGYRFYSYGDCMLIR